MFFDTSEKAIQLLDLRKYKIELEIFNIINLIVVAFFIIIFLMQHVHAIVAIFTKKKKWDEAKIEHNFGVLICGRNEENVISKLIDSVFSSDYDKNKLHVFVCADNCTDNTAAVARKAGAIVYERFNNELVGKSYAMDFLIKKIMSNPSNNNIECFFVFDSDNLVSTNYFKEMNKVFDAGYEVSTSYRQSKNFDTNWISGCSSLTFFRECSIVHHSRQKLGLGTYVSGTGYFISRRIIESLNGWNFNTMTEDIEFSAWCAINNIKISYNENAIFYDEQPEKLKVANTQRLRWCKGTHQCCYKYHWALLKGIFRSKMKLTCFELLVHVTPFPLLSVIWMIIYLIGLGIFNLVGIININDFLQQFFNNCFSFFFGILVVSQIQALIATIKNNSNINASIFKKLLYIFLFPVYVSMYIYLSLKALFVKVKWKPIPHVSTNVVTLKEINKLDKTRCKSINTEIK